MKNKPDSALLRPSNLSNEIKKTVPKSREPVPLREKAWYYFSIEDAVASQWTDPNIAIKFWTAGDPDSDRKCNQASSKGEPLNIY
jgi:hypothetical protein